MICEGEGTDPLDVGGGTCSRSSEQQIFHSCLRD